MFVILAFITVLLGGHARADAGGVLFLFIIGGVVGLIVWSIYNKGRKDAATNEYSKKDDDHAA